MSALRLPRLVLLGLALVVCAPARPGPATDDPPAKSDPWTFDEAVKRLALSPRDSYLQYVVLQLGRRDGREQEAVNAVEGRNRGWRGLFDQGRGRGQRADLFATFTGALAIQESLQLDTMRGDRPDRPQPPGTPPGAPKVKSPEKVSLTKLTGPTVPSHPWEKMLGAKTPDVGPLAPLVPEDFYLAEFGSVTKLHAVLGAGGLWGGHIFAQSLGDARSHQTADRVKTQLGLLGLAPETLDKLGVEGVAVTGSDPFLSEGSDVTLLVKGKNIAALARLTEGGAGNTTPGEHVGVKYTHRATPDGTVNVFTATPRPDLHVRGNSLPPFKRVLESVVGKGADGKPAKRLGESAEFKYVRSIMPRGAAGEDGFVYLSDSFIRRLVGPQLKITERRRVVAYTHLRMIGHAALLFRTEHGRPPKSLQELADTKCAPGVFGQGDLAHPDGGAYSLTPDGMSGVCSKFGKANSLTPCAERLVTEATGDEAAEYTQFVAEYSQYWRTFFDPIAVRVGVTEKQLRLETLVLPLIDNSIYTELARGVGKPVAMDLLPTPKREIGGVWLHFDKQPLIDALAGVQPAKKDERAAVGGVKHPLEMQNDLKQIALAMHNHHDAFEHLPTTNVRDAAGKPLLSWRVAILPFVEQDALYREFKLDEPWDSEHNKKLIPKMPKVYQSGDAALTKAGKTTYLLPSGNGTLSPPDPLKIKLAVITDGTSNTILAVVADPERAVVWTKPDDLPFDPKDPLKGLVRPGHTTIDVAMADGSIQRLSTTTDPKTITAMVTPAGGEVVDVPGRAADNPRGGPPIGLGVFREFVPSAGHVRDLEQFGVDLAKLRRFLKDGIGDQVGLHMHDAPRLLDSDLSGLVGDPTGEGGWAMIGVAVRFVFGASSVSIPVKDAKVVDEYLAEFDKFLLAQRATATGLGVAWRRDADFYTFALAGGQTVRCLSATFFGMKWRLYWARIGDGLYVVTRPFILEDLAAAHAGGKRPAKTEPAHAVLRVRPENWNAVLPGYNLGWAEGHRAACHANLDMVANVNRGWNDRTADDAARLGRVARVYGARPYCPEGGTYSLAADGRSCRCSVHGGHDDPRQPPAPTDASATGKLMKSFSGLTAAIRFEDDGLRIVVTVDRGK